MPRLSVRDSYDDDDLTDIDDEVFIRDGKSDRGLKINDDFGVKKPLMAPRRKPRLSGNFEHQKLPWRSLLIPVCYGAVALIILLGLILAGILTVNMFPSPFNILKKLFPGNTQMPISNYTNEILPCTSLSSNILWVRTLPKLISQAPLRNIDVNNDGVDDIIIGFTTDFNTRLNALDLPETFCKLYFGEQIPCSGGIMALNGQTGDTLWTHWTENAIFSIDCALDITDDTIKDCIITGRGGILHVINGNDGTMIWQMLPKDFPYINHMYNARFIHDIDGDAIGDVIISHTTHTNFHSSEIIIVSGKFGKTVKIIDFPKSERLFIAPQILVHPDGEIIYLLASNTPEQSGGLYIISEVDLLYGNTGLKTLQHGKGKGVILPPILVDITSDGTEDIIVSSLDSTITAYNGLSFDPIWNYTVADSEIISVPIPGFYNDDNIPDLMVKHQIGPGFPEYYYSLLTILDGNTGKPLLDKPIRDEGKGQISGLSLSIDGYGNDWFLYWSANCLDHDNFEEKYRFLKGQTLTSQNRALCKLPNAALKTQLFAMSQHVGPPGQSIYSENWHEVELNYSTDSKKQSEKYLTIVSNDNDGDNSMIDGPIIAQRSPESILSQIKYNNHFPNMENGPILDEQGDYFIKNSNEKKDVDPYPVFNDLPQYKTKILNDFPSKIDWNNENTWYNNPMNKQYDVAFGERDDDLELPQQIEQREPRSRSIRDIRKKRHDNTNINKNYDKTIVQSVPRQPPTGLLLSSLSKTKNKIEADLVFSIHQLPFSDESFDLLLPDFHCIQKKVNQNLYVHEDIITACLAERDINNKLYKNKVDQDYVKIALGQMKIYRMKLGCTCPDDMLPGQTCKNISINQSWPAYLGHRGDGDFKIFTKIP